MVLRIAMISPDYYDHYLQDFTILMRKTFGCTLNMIFSGYVDIIGISLIINRSLLGEEFYSFICLRVSVRDSWL